MDGRKGELMRQHGPSTAVGCWHLGQLGPFSSASCLLTVAGSCRLVIGKIYHDDPRGRAGTSRSRFSASRRSGDFGVEYPRIDFSSDGAVNDWYK